MANEVLQKEGTVVIWADTTYAPATNNVLGSWSSANDIDVAGLTADQARGSVKADMGETRARQHSVMMSVEMEDDPAAGETIDLHWSPSMVITAAVANAGGHDGVDGDYAGYGASTLAEGLAEMLYIGSLPLAVMNDADGVPQLGFVGVFSLPLRHGSLIWHNNSGVVVFADSLEAAVAFIPIIDEVQ